MTRAVSFATKESTLLSGDAGNTFQDHRQQGRWRLAVNSTSESYSRKTPCQSLPEAPISEPMRNTRNDYLSAFPRSAGCLPARIRYLPQIRPDSMRMKQPSGGKRRRFAAFRTIICREQMMSAHGEGETGNRSRGWPGPRLERVLKAANRLRFMAQRFSQTRFTLANPDRHDQVQ